jgi:hypothetical protein
MAPVTPTCRGCGVAPVRRSNRTGLCGRCRPRATCSICGTACGRGNPCPDCVAVCANITLAHRDDSACRPPARQLPALLALYRARAAAGADLWLPDDAPPGPPPGGRGSGSAPWP